MTSITAMVAASIAAANGNACIQQEAPAPKIKPPKAPSRRAEATRARRLAHGAATRAKIIEAIQTAGRPLTVAEINEHTGLSYGRDMIRIMAISGALIRTPRPSGIGYLFSLPSREGGENAAS